MIEVERSPRWRTDPKLQVGHWIQFEEEFWYGEAAPSYSGPSSDVVHFGAINHQDNMFLLCGSQVHVLDKRQRPTVDRRPRRSFYTSEVGVNVFELGRFCDEQPVTEPPVLL